VLPSNTGRRPMRSESRPQIGAKTNCIAEKDEMITPIIRPDIVVSTPNMGSTSF
jgi:hypothetical protein